MACKIENEKGLLEIRAKGMDKECWCLNKRRIKQLNNRPNKSEGNKEEEDKFCLKINSFVF